MLINGKEYEEIPAKGFLNCTGCAMLKTEGCGLKKCYCKLDKILNEVKQ